MRTVHRMDRRIEEMVEFGMELSHAVGVDEMGEVFQITEEEDIEVQELVWEMRKWDRGERYGE